MTDGWDPGARDRVPAWVVLAVVAVGAVLAAVAVTGGDPPAPIPVDTVTADDERAREVRAPARRLERVAGVGLIRDGGAFSECVEAASLVGHALPCMTQRPRGGERVSCVGTCLRGGGYVVAIRRFEVPSRWCEGCVPELVIAAAPVNAPSLVSALTACDPRTPEVGRRGRLIECRAEPASWAGLAPHAGNTLGSRRARGVVYAVSADGHGPAQAALVTHVLDELMLVGG